MKIQNYSEIKLLNDKYIEEGVSKNQIGYVIEVYDDGYEVEFSDENGNTIALFSVKEEDIEKTENK